MLRQVAEGVLIHQSEFCQSNAVVVHGRAGVLLIDPGVLGDEMTALASRRSRGRCHVRARLPPPAIHQSDRAVLADRLARFGEVPGLLAV